MLRIFFVTLVVLSSTFLLHAQEKTNDAIARQIKSLQSDRSITISFDQAGNSSKIMAVATNFSDNEADRAGLQAMNFAMGFFYPGTTLKVSPENIHFTFWVLSKKPRFAENHKFAADLDGRQIDLGDARYAAKPRENLEYLNFELSRNQLVSIAGAKSVIFRLGPYSFTATPDQRRLVNSVVRIADISITN